LPELALIRAELGLNGVKNGFQEAKIVLRSFYEQLFLINRISTLKSIV